MSLLRRLLPLITLSVAILALYFYKLDGVGMIGPDEPRYAAIGRTMAETGQYVTPTLWGSPWFEKPPLLYWMTALGTKAGLNRELSARLPIALLSISFLAIMFVLVRREFGTEASAASTALLASSAGWIAYSGLGLTDPPLAVFFALAVLLAFPLLRTDPDRTRLAWRFACVGVCFGAGTLAKGLVPLALAAPFAWYLRRYWRQWWIAAVACLAVALPWYVAVYRANGFPFIQDFFLKHHLERLYSPSLQHVQPWYYFVPVLLAGLFPWTPLVVSLVIPKESAWWDQRRSFLLAVTLFGLVFFSISLNKLPHYLLPLLPCLFVLLGSQLEFRSSPQVSRWWLFACAPLIATMPLLSQVLAPSLSLGRISFVSVHTISRTEWFYILLPLIVVVLARRSWVGLLLVLCIAANGIYLKDRTFPELDKNVSARQLFKKIRTINGSICDNYANRDFIYGLDFYRGSSIPSCQSGRFDYELRSYGHGPPVLQRRQ